MARKPSIAIDDWYVGLLARVLLLCKGGVSSHVPGEASLRWPGPSHRFGDLPPPRAAEEAAAAQEC